MNRRLAYTPGYVRDAKRLAKGDARCAHAITVALDRLAADAFDPRLHTHKLHGDLDGSWACSAGYDLRIIFALVEDNGGEAVLLESIGTHDDVY